MATVLAHTNAVGTFHINQRNVWIRQTQTGSKTTMTSAEIAVASSYKSATKVGAYSALVPGFRTATTYGRVVRKLTSNGHVSFLNPYTCGNPSRWYLYNGESAIHSSGIAPAIYRYSFSGLVSVDSGIVNRAETECLAKIGEMKVNISVALAEARKTVNMIASRVITLIQLLRLLGKRRFRAAWYLLKRYWRRQKRIYSNVWKSKNWTYPFKGKPTSQVTPANAWLEYSYGWLPLINDIYGGIELVNTGFRSKRFLFNAERTVKEPLDPRLFFGNGSDNLSCSGNALQSAKVTLWAVITDLVHNGNMIGILNPALVAWELVPFSFVFDWLVPVGTWLESLSATAGVAFIDGHCVRKIEVDVTATNLTPGHGCKAEADGYLPSARQQLLAMQRSLYHDWPRNLPYWKNPLSSSHVTSAAALIAQSSRR